MPLNYPKNWEIASSTYVRTNIYSLNNNDSIRLCAHVNRPARTDVPSMYAEDDGFEEEYTRAADIRQSRASLNRGSRYVTEGFVQYSQPSLNGTQKAT